MPVCVCAECVRKIHVSIRTGGNIGESIMMTWIRKSCSRLTLDPAIRTHAHSHAFRYCVYVYAHRYYVYARLEVGNGNGICFVWPADVFSILSPFPFLFFCFLFQLLFCFNLPAPQFHLRSRQRLVFQLCVLCFHCLAAWLFKAQLSAETFAKYYWTPSPRSPPIVTCQRVLLRYEGYTFVYTRMVWLWCQYIGLSLAGKCVCYIYRHVHSMCSPFSLWVTPVPSPIRSLHSPPHPSALTFLCFRRLPASICIRTVHTKSALPTHTDAQTDTAAYTYIRTYIHAILRPVSVWHVCLCCVYAAWPIVSRASVRSPTHIARPPCRLSTCITHMEQQPTKYRQIKKGTSSKKRIASEEVIKKIAQIIYSFTWQTRAAPQQTINGLKVERNWVSNRNL